jgi:hypothetical protein
MAAMALKWGNQSAKGLVDAMLNLKSPENPCALHLWDRGCEFVSILANKVKKAGSGKKDRRLSPNSALLVRPCQAFGVPFRENQPIPSLFVPSSFHELPSIGLQRQ